MKNYMAMYMASPEAIAEMMGGTPEQMQAGMDAWMKWFGTHKASIVEMGDALGKTRRVDSSGTADMKNGATGYTVVKADSFEAATKIFDKHPHLGMKGTWIEVMQCMGMQDMAPKP